MVVIVRGDAEIGFTLYGPFETATQASHKARTGDLIAHLNPPRYNPDDDAYDSIDAYVRHVLGNEDAWALLRPLHRGGRGRRVLPRRRRLGRHLRDPARPRALNPLTPLER
jgi:hypothetical protein